MAETKIVSNRLDSTATFSLSANQFGDGTVGAPSITFAADTDTGFYRPGANQLYFTTNGVVRMGIDSAGNVYNPGVYYTENGTAAAPALTFNGDTNTGIYRQGADDIRMSAGGVGVVKWTASGQESFLQHFFADGTVSLPSITFGGDTDTGVYRVGANTMGFSTGGVERMELNTNGLVVPAAAGTIITGSVTSGTAGTPAFRPGGRNTGIYAAIADHVQISSDSSPVADFFFSNTDFYTGSGSNRIALSITDSGSSITLGSGFGFSVQNGLVTAPGVRFTSRQTGMYSPAQDVIAFTTDSVEVMELGTAATRQVRIVDGSSSVPALSFINDTDSGLMRVGSNQVAIVCGASQVAIFNSDTANANQLTMNSASGNQPVFGLSVANSASGAVPNADSRGVAISVNDGNAGDPYMLWAIGGPTRYWTLGIDNSNSDVMVFSTTAGGTAKPGTGDVLLVAPNCLQILDGSASVPGLTFINDPDTGIFRPSSNTLDVTLGGVGCTRFSTTQVIPYTDNGFGLGANGSRWTAVWAANGTIQTSHSSTKEVLGEIAGDAEIPQGIYFKRPGSERIHVGFLADNLPQEAFYEDGISVETASPIGVLCANVRRLDRENKELKQMVQDLIKKLDA